jgi:hypothetical protein
MLLYLTGASTSLVKSEDNPQTDASKSLGGYISSTPAPNAALNSLFDMISSYTLEKRQKETIALGLINQLETDVKNVELKIVTDVDNVAIFKVAAVAVNSDNYRMESISSRYQEPMAAEFHDASFYRACVDLEVTQYAGKDEEIALYPFGISFVVQEEGWEGTWKAFEEAFSNDETYEIRRISERTYRIGRRDDTLLETPLKCFYITTEGFKAEFLGELSNKADNTVLISEQLEPKEAIGLWIQRDIKDSSVSSNEQLLEDYKHHVIKETVEDVEIVISYDLVEP